ncbi:hypothetical protein DLM45_00920 [Hyphomicrobium methylovorum]|uniref:lysozyme inhibitor LprI family protein n=1 Tax=Hyphomicrobium methylovorum TaxID=84 RepID=UPI0015E6355E|nr:lysozyme inhibitor LprI family protein [Hyphomicrobium methylovorum]MBA2124786.1 hypothetical protein [Hyphomicrobium methylovorum]
MQKALTLAISLAALAPLLALSTAAEARSKGINCAKANSTYEINYCADRDFTAADKELNKTYRRAIRKTRERDLDEPYDSAQYEGAMRKAQRAWVGYRDADCKHLTAQEWSGGTGTSAAVLGCMTEKTTTRTRELQERYEAE